MALHVVGLERKQGDWDMNGRSGTYDNVVIYCTDDLPIDGLSGVRVKEFKIKTSLLDVDISVGDVIKVYFNEYRKPESVVVL